MLVDKIRLEPGETILVQTRRHWFIIVAQIVSVALTALFPLLLIPVINNFLTGVAGTDATIGTYWAPLLYLYCLYLTFLWMGIFSLWTNYYLDVLTVTDRRIVIVNQKGFFWRNVASFRLERMQDINIEVNGLIPTMLDYGTVEIETASDSDDDFTAHQIPHPADIKATILQAGDERLRTMTSHHAVGH